MDTRDRFWAKVDKNGRVPIHRPDLGRCWEWQGARQTTGYGRFYPPERRGVRAHVYAKELMGEPCPEGLEGDHLCRNRGCVRPSHVQWVTHAENMRRAALARTHCKHGHELTPANVYIRPDNGARFCRACGNRRTLAWYHRQAKQR